MKLTEWLDNHKEGHNICPPPMTAEEFERFLIDYLLGENYTIIMPMPDAQCRTQILHDILYEYCKKYRNE